MTCRTILYAASLATAAAGAASAQDTIRGLAPTWVGFAPALVAGDLGYFEEEDLVVDFRFEDDRTNVLAAMERGDIEVDMRTVGEHQGRPRVDETPGTIIGVIDLSVGGDGVLVDGSIETVADLAGRTIAIEPNIPARLLLQMEMREAGLSFDDVELREIATADTIAVFADPRIAAVGTYEPFLSQAASALPDREPRILVDSRERSNLIIDIITARDDDLAANPEKFAKFLRGIYRAIDFHRENPERFAELAAPHYGLTPAEVTEIIETSLVYTSYEEALDFMGSPGTPGKLHAAFDQVMDLNIEYGAADVRLVANDEIDASIIQGLFDDAAR
jgi:NitT/TauT family transport system substrate-binding protein